MKVLISGASGMIGRALQEELKNSDHQVVCLVRDKSKASDEAIYWDPKIGQIDPSSLEGFDAVINLAGESIAEKWTEERKKEILESRVDATKTLATALASLNEPPKVFINSSAIGYYGNRGDEICTEKTPNGSGFLADVCRQWEQAAQAAEEKGIRTVFLRTGVVLSSEGGALVKMLPPFRFGLGGKLGSGEQYMSWISIDDLIGIILYTLINDSVKGPVNAVAPAAIKNVDFTKTLGKVLDRPTFFAVPEFALKFLMGNEMAEELLLYSIRAEPKELMMDGYSFKTPDLERTLKYLVDKVRKKMEVLNGPKSPKSFLATLLFCIFLGTFGVHRFYVNKIGTGILMLLTAGGLGIWWLIDLILIVSMRFRDKQERLIEP